MLTAPGVSPPCQSPPCPPPPYDPTWRPSYATFNTCHRDGTVPPPPPPPLQAQTAIELDRLPTQQLQADCSWDGQAKRTSARMVSPEESTSLLDDVVITMPATEGNC